MGVEVWVTIAALATWFSFPLGMVVANYFHDKGHINVKKDTH